MTRSPFYFSIVGTLIFKMNRAGQDQFLRVHFILIFMMLLLTIFVRCQSKNSLLLRQRHVLPLILTTLRIFPKMRRLGALCHLVCFSSRKQHTIYRRLHYKRCFQNENQLFILTHWIPFFDGSLLCNLLFVLLMYGWQCYDYLKSYSSYSL